MGNQTPFTICVSIIYQTGKAYKVTDEDGNIIWLPKSQIEEIEEVAENVVNITIPEWLAKEKGFI